MAARGYAPPVMSGNEDDRDPGHPEEPETAEVESAALLANESADLLPNLDRDQVRRLADLFIAEGNDGGAEVFVPWALERRSSSRR